MTTAAIQVELSVAAEPCSGVLEIRRLLADRQRRLWGLAR